VRGAGLAPGCYVEAFLVIGSFLVVVWLLQRAKARALARLLAAKVAYDVALSRLEEPHEADARVEALRLGRVYAEMNRKMTAGSLKAAQKAGVTLFDEVALQNDLAARPHRARAPTADESREARMVAKETRLSSSDRIAQLERLSQLRKDGTLTAEEFEHEKRRILG
jgi:aryl-alcohol dehydrogenase-like predicted oxidoreductase